MSAARMNCLISRRNCGVRKRPDTLYMSKGLGFGRRCGHVLLLAMFHLVRQSPSPPSQKKMAEKSTSASFSQFRSVPAFARAHFSCCPVWLFCEVVSPAVRGVFDQSIHVPVG